MARKTYHHLKKGDVVTLQLVSWCSGAEEVVETIPGEVIDVLRRRVVIEFSELRTFTPLKTLKTPKDEVPSPITKRHLTADFFSRQGGQRWGGSEEDYRIDPLHARKKE